MSLASSCPPNVLKNLSISYSKCALNVELELTHGNKQPFALRADERVWFTWTDL